MRTKSNKWSLCGVALKIVNNGFDNYSFIENGETDMEELRRLLLQVSDSYSDFVIGVMAEARYCPQKLGDLIQYIMDNPEATSSDIGKWTMINIEGIDPENPPPMEIVDDDEE